MKKHTLSGCQLQVRPFQEDSVPKAASSDAAVSSSSIRVTGFSDQMSEDMLEMYFESKKSGGTDGAITNCVIIKEGIAHLTFNDPKG